VRPPAVGSLDVPMADQARTFGRASRARPGSAPPAEDGSGRRHLHHGVNDHREAIYFIRGTDAKGALLEGRNTYTMTFAKDALPPMDRSRGGFWSLTMYDKDYFMLAKSPNGRTNIGTVNLDANELKFAPARRKIVRDEGV
jgi:Protein of unknown function (DUF1214)